MWRLNSLFGRSCLKQSRNATTRTVQRLGDKDDCEEQRKVLPTDRQNGRGREEFPDSPGTWIGAGCLGLVGGAAATIAMGQVHQFVQLARDTELNEKENWICGSGMLSCGLKSISSTLAHAQPMLISAHRVLPSGSTVPGLNTDSKDDNDNEENGQGCSGVNNSHCNNEASVRGKSWLKTVSVQTDENIPSDPEEKGPLGQLDAAELQLEEAVLDCQSTVRNWMGVSLIRRGLFSEAFRYFDKASVCGHSKATYNLGMCYYKGYGRASSLEKALELWKKAADQGHGGALYQLGVCHILGLGVPKNVVEGKEYIERATASDVPEAQLYCAAVCLKEGKTDMGRKLLQRSANQGNQSAVSLLKRIEDKHGGVGDLSENSSEKSKKENDSQMQSDVCISRNNSTNSRSSIYESDGTSGQSSVIFSNSPEKFHAVERIARSKFGLGMHKSKTVHDFRVFRETNSDVLFV